MSSMPSHKDGEIELTEVERALLKTVPYQHQLEEWRRYRDRRSHALWWEMGTGKTKVVLDTLAWLHQLGEVDALLVVAPNGLHVNWVEEEVPRHLAPKHEAMAWMSHKTGTQWHQRKFARLVREKKLAVLAISYAAVMTPKGVAAVRKFLNIRCCLMVADESARIKTPGAKRTRRMIALGERARHKRILTGTPVANQPFDVFSQIKFLDPNFWKRTQNIDTFTEYKSYYARWEKKYNAKTEKYYDTLEEYENLDELRQQLEFVGTRVLKEECLDLPPKLYSTVRFDLTPKQRRAYEELEETCMTELEDGTVVTAVHALPRLLRLQQVSSGYLPDDMTRKLSPIDSKNPRLELLKELVEDLSHKAIVWCRFREDILQVVEALGPERCVTYYGDTKAEDRRKAVVLFQDPDSEIKFFVGNPSAAGEGLTLTQARSEFYYSNSFALPDRLQSEDRAHRIGQEHPVNIYDLVARDTVDEHIVGTLRSKKNVADMVTGDVLREWLG